MPYTRKGVLPPGKYTRKSSAGAPRPRVKLSLLGRAYNKVRWTCYFLPVLGFIIIGYGIYLALWHPIEDIIVSQTLIGAGAVMTYLAIYYNKRT